MKNSGIKTLGIICILFLFLPSYGQIKHPVIPTFRSPFQSKTAQARQKNIITPNEDHTVAKLRSKIKTINGSFSADFQKENLSKETAVTQFNVWFNLTKNHTFKQDPERTDELGFSHTNFRQYYKGFAIDGRMIMLHSKNGKVTHINGNVSEFNDVETEISISSEQAKNIAKQYLKVTNLINDYLVETVIATIPGESETIIKLTHKVRIDSWSPFEMCYVYVDVRTGNVLNKINLIAHADVAGTAQTLYSGTQNITCDNFANGGYRLRESGRKIETYNATNATGISHPTNGWCCVGYVGATDFTRNSTTFSAVPRLKSFSVSSVVQSWWYAAFVDQLPDLYIKIKDRSNQIVYTSGYYSDQNLPVTFNNLNIYLNNPPYTVEVWDYDAGSVDDFGGSYSISTSV